MLDKFYAEYDVPSETVPNFIEEDFDNSFEDIKKFLADMNRENGVVSQYGKTLAHFYSLWGYVLLSKPPAADPGLIAQRYAGFMDRVSKALAGDMVATSNMSSEQEKAVAAYAANVRGANTDTTPRNERLKALTNGLNV